MDNDYDPCEDCMSYEDEGFSACDSCKWHNWTDDGPTAEELNGEEWWADQGDDE